MINTTDQPLVLSNGAGLHKAIVGATNVAIDLLEKQIGKRPTTQNIRDYGFYRLLGTQNHRAGVTLDERFIRAALHVSQADSQNSTAREARLTINDYVTEANLPAHGLPSLKRGLKLLFVELWRSRAVLLPTTFIVGPHFQIALHDHPLLNWVRTFKPEKCGGTSGGHRLYYYGPRLLWTADWQSPGDVALSDLAALNRALILYRSQQSSVVIAGGTQLPITLFAAELLKAFPSLVPYTESDLERYSAWMNSKCVSSQTLDQYNAPKQTPPKSKVTTPARFRSRNSQELGLSFVEPAAYEDGHEALKVNYVKLQRGHRRSADWTVHDAPTYLGREHVKTAALAGPWIEAFRAYMHHRTHVKEYRSSGGPNAALNLLADYLFFYLPWWREVAKLPKVDLPASPAAFSRFAFVARHTSESMDEFPATLLKVIGWRRKSKESVAAAVHQLGLFFSFVETHFAENKNIAGDGFRSPLNPDFDAPRIGHKGKTTKEVIPKNIYSYFLFYAYAVEEAGIRLEQLAVEGRLNSRGDLRDALWFRTEDFGFSLKVKCRSKDLPLDEVPNVFQWAERNLSI